MPINPGVYCSAPRQPLFYGCAFKNKSSVRPNWLQNGSSTKRTTRLGDGKSCHGPNRTATKWDFCEPHTGRNSCPAFKYIWCESMWSLRHHTSHQEGKIWTWKAASLGSTTALGRDVGRQEKQLFHTDTASLGRRAWECCHMDVGRGSSRGPVLQRSRAAAATAGRFWWEPCPEGLIWSISAALFGVEG
uniref:Uncharacterized protein n=1 Tax=Anas platyrhynchos platyrhynchos TaxID=8840 RepID=A0A493TXI5_ANAPP